MTVKEVLLKKKYLVISYHEVREAAAAGMAHQVMTPGTNNFAGLLTKSEVSCVYRFTVGGVMCGSLKCLRDL